MTYDKAILRAAERIADSLGLTKHQAGPIAAILTEELPPPWQDTATTLPPNDGVDQPLFLMSRGDRFPKRGYYRNGWRDNYGKPMTTVPGYWTQIPPLPARTGISINELRDRFLMRES